MSTVQASVAQPQWLAQLPPVQRQNPLEKPLNSVDQRLDLGTLKQSLRKYEQAVGADSSAERILSDMNVLMGIGYVSNNPGLVSSAFEQSQAVQSNIIGAATADLAQLTAMRGRVVAMLGQGLVNASGAQAALTRINGQMAVLGRTLDAISGQLGQINLQTAQAGLNTDLQRLQQNLDGLREQIGAAQQQLGLDLRNADLQVAQIQASADGELLTSRIALRSSLDQARSLASTAFQGGLQRNQPGKLEPDATSGITLPPAVLGTEGPLSEAQRVQVLRHFFPFAQTPQAQINQLVPPAAAGGQPYDTTGIARRVGLPDYKQRLGEIEKQYGNLDRAAQAYGLQSGTQLRNFIDGVNSGQFDPLQLNQQFQKAQGKAANLLSDVGRVSAQFLQNNGRFNFLETFEQVGKAAAREMGSIPPALQDYAREANANVYVLMGMAVFNSGKAKTDATANYLANILANPFNPAVHANEANKLINALKSSGELAPLANTIGNRARLERVMIQYTGLQVAQFGAETSNQSLRNAVGSLANARANVLDSVEVAQSNLGRTQQQLNNLQTGYASALTALQRQGVNEASLGLLQQQLGLSRANLERAIANQQLQLSLAQERLNLAQRSNERKVFDFQALNAVFTPMVRWNARQADQASRYGVQGLYARTPQGLVIPPTLLQKYTQGQPPTAAQLQAASDETLAAFAREYPDAAQQLRTGGSAAQAAVQLFLTGDPQALLSRSPIQAGQQSPGRQAAGGALPPLVLDLQGTPPLPVDPRSKPEILDGVFGH